MRTAPGSTIGEMRDRVAILKTSKTPDGQGGKVTTWVDLVTGTSTRTRLAASVRGLAAQDESLLASKVTASIAYLVTMRYRADITELMRVEWTPYKASVAQLLQIIGVAPLDGDRARIVLQCGRTN